MNEWLLSPDFIVRHITEKFRTEELIKCNVAQILYPHKLFEAYFCCQKIEYIKCKIKWKVHLTFSISNVILMESKLYIRKGDCLKNRLEEIRKEKGITQEELAKILEVSRQTIGSLESGRYNPSIILAFKIADYFDMKIEDIFMHER